MSSYVVSHSTLDVILSTLDTRDSVRIVETFRPFTLPDDPRDVLDRLGDSILALNRAAAEHAHGPSDAPAYPFPYRHRHDSRPLPWTLKQLDCLIYQLSEGEIVRNPLYLALEKLRRELADRLISALPEYQAAPWGMPVTGQE